jgi:hypothetical protein
MNASYKIERKGQYYQLTVNGQPLMTFLTFQAAVRFIR